MAWFAELKRRRWYCINGQNMIRWYSRYLYDLWLSTSSEEQKAFVEEIKRKEKERNDMELCKRLMKLGMIDTLTGNMRYADKYKGVYDKWGYPKG